MQAHLCNICDYLIAGTGCLIKPNAMEDRCHVQPQSTQL